MAENDIRIGYEEANFAQRRQLLLRNAADAVTDFSDPKADLYANAALSQLYLGCNERAANEKIRRLAQWFDHPHPVPDRHIRGESDFAAMKLAFAHYLFQGTAKFESQTVDQIERFFLINNFQSIYNSENHLLLFHASRYLMAQAMPNRVFEAWEKSGSSLADEDLAWLKKFIRYRAGHGWGEFDSSCYQMPDFEAMTTLYDYASDAELKQLAAMMLDLLLADTAVDCLHGMVGGAQGRIYPPQALDHAMELTNPIQYLFLGNPEVGRLSPCHVEVQVITTHFRASPVVAAIAQDRSQPYVNRERKHLHNMSDVQPHHPLRGSIRKYTYWTPDYVLGCVQKQDAYPADLPADVRVYAGHQQHDWDLTFATHSKARLFTHHPGNDGPQHNYWTGDFKCCCGRFMQHRSALLALHDIPKDQFHQQIHAYIPRAAFDEIAEEDGWIFVRAGQGYGALNIVGGYQWVKTEPWVDMEVRSEQCGRIAVVCQAGQQCGYGSFTAFRRQVITNQVSFDSATMRLSYAAGELGTLTLGPGCDRRFNGQPLNLDYPLYDSPYMQSEWGSGVIELTCGNRHEQLNFNTATRE